MIPDAWRRGEVAVVGLGKTGVAASKWLAGQGVAVYASDAADTATLRVAAAALELDGVATHLGAHDLERIRNASAVIVSPGVPPDAPAVQAARTTDIEVLAELDLAARALAGTRLIVVTGTNGKTTTTTLVSHLLRCGGVDTATAGNIGRPLIEVAADDHRPDIVAVEASSFQLHDSPHLTPTVGVVTNLAADHMDRYDDVASYYADKRLLFRNASRASVWVLNANDPAVLDLAMGVEGHRRHWSLQEESDAWFDRAGGRLMLGDTALLSRGDFPLLGDHNVENALAAALAASAVGVDARAIAQGLTTFQPLPHRLEPIRTIDDVLWINDSKATNVASTAVALQAVQRPFVLIVGGRLKGELRGALAAIIPEPCRAVVAYGEAAPTMAAELADVVPVYAVSGFDEAVRRAADLASSGDAVLLSPACASFDQFTNYEERGDRFRDLVEAM